MPTDNKEAGFAAYPATLAASTEDLNRSVKQFLGRVLFAKWSDAAEGILLDPLPNPKRYLCFGLSLGSVRLLYSLDLGAPGWFASRCHVMEREAKPGS